MFTEVAEHVEKIRRHLFELRREIKSKTVHGGADCSLVKALISSPSILLCTFLRAHLFSIFRTFFPYSSSRKHEMAEAQPQGKGQTKKEKLSRQSTDIFALPPNQNSLSPPADVFQRRAPGHDAHVDACHRH
jgi:hypothetical protein